MKTEVKNPFKKEVTFIAFDYEFDGLVESVYGQDCSVTAEEDALYDSSISFHIKPEVDDYDEKAIAEFIETGEYPMTHVLLNDMCKKGILEKGQYFIKYFG